MLELLTAALTRNWPLKLLSLALALALWVAVTGIGVIVQDVTVPVEISLGESYTLIGAKPTVATVRLRGPETLLRGIDRSGMELLIDLGETSTGERTVQLSENNLVGRPRGLELTGITPDRLTLQVDWKSRRPLPVVPSLLDQPPEGYAFYSARMVPDTLTVEGPRSEVRALNRLRTDPISLEGRTQPFMARVGAVPESPEIRVVESQLLEAHIEVDVAPVDAAFDAVPVVLAGQVHEAAATPSSIEVVLSGPPALLERIRPGQIRAIVDVSELAPSTEPYHLAPRVEFVDVPAADLPRISVKSMSRESVTVRLSGRRIAE